MHVRFDIIFTRLHVLSFWTAASGCALHQRVPRSNAENWIPEVEGNVARDRRVDSALAAAGWIVRRVWEHEDPEIAARAYGHGPGEPNLSRSDRLWKRCRNASRQSRNAVSVPPVS